MMLNNNLQKCGVQNGCGTEVARLRRLSLVSNTLLHFTTSKNHFAISSSLFVLFAKYGVLRRFISIDSSAERVAELLHT